MNIDIKEIKKFKVEITCKKCKGPAEIEDTRDYDIEDGPWGSIDLYCPKCNVRERIAT